MARRFEGLSWKWYDEALRKMRSSQLCFGQIHGDLWFRCLEQAVNKQGAYSFWGTPAPLTTESEAVSPSAQACPVEVSRKPNAINSSNLALAPGLRANSNVHAPSVPENTQHVDVACIQPDHKGLDAQGRCILPMPINSKLISRYLVNYDKLETSILLYGFSMDFPLHYDAPQCMRFSDNHQSVLQAAPLVDEKN